MEDGPLAEYKDRKEGGLMQTPILSLCEAITNTIVGIAISQIVLAGFGIHGRKALSLTLLMIILSTLRTYFIRRGFNWIG